MNITKYKFTFLVLFIAGILLNPVSVAPVSASSAKQQIEKNRQQHKKLWVRVKELEQEKGSLSDVVAAIDEKVESKELEIETIRNELAEANERREKLQADKDMITADLELNKGMLKDRARNIYMQGDMSYLELIFQSNGFSDLVDRVFFVQAILEHDESLVKKAEQMQIDLAGKISKLDAQIVDIDGIKQELENQLSELEDIKGDKELALKAIDQDKNLTLRQIDELEEENKRITAQLREIANSASGYKGAPWTGSFKKPCPGKISSGYGMRVHPVYKTKKMHTGVDIGAAKGTTIKAAGKGKVIYTGRKGGYGKTVMVDHGNNRVTLYAHMSKITCDAGDIVDTSSKLGEVGSTGVSTGNHLHFEVRINGETVDPLKEL